MLGFGKEIWYNENHLEQYSSSERPSLLDLGLSAVTTADHEEKLVEGKIFYLSFIVHHMLCVPPWILVWVRSIYKDSEGRKKGRKKKERPLEAFRCLFELGDVLKNLYEAIFLN